VNNEPTAETPLEPYLPMPRGGVAPRCQRVKRDAVQCSKPARTGYKICSSHGAGFASREAAGERQKPGRPVTTGVYSTQPTRSYSEAQAEVAQLEDALTSSDRDLLALKAVLVQRIGALEAHAPAVQDVEAVLEALVAEAAQMDVNNIAPEQATCFVGRLAGVLRPVARLSALVSQVADVSTKSITASKVRAETRAKLAEAEGLEVWGELKPRTGRVVVTRVQTVPLAPLSRPPPHPRGRARAKCQGRLARDESQQQPIKIVEAGARLHRPL